MISKKTITKKRKKIYKSNNKNFLYLCIFTQFNYLYLLKMVKNSYQGC